MKMIFAVAILFGMSAMATSSNEKQLKEALKIADEQDYPFGNGQGDIYKYNVKKFKLKSALNQVKSDYSSGKHSDCEFEFDADIQSNLKSLNSNDFNESPAIKDALNDLNKRKQIKAIVSANWDYSSGDSEYCSIWNYKVYTVDGLVLDMVFDHTD